MRRMLATLVIGVALVAAACGDDDDTTGAAPTSAGAAATTGAATVTTAKASADDGYGGGVAATTAPASETSGSASEEGGGEVSLAATSLGQVLVDQDGHTLYLFQPDAQAKSTCYDQCEDTWPYLDAASGVGDGLKASLLGTTMRTDGEAQATYNGWPLYRFSGDKAKGDTNGEGIGGVWFPIDASGNKVSK